MENKCYWKNVNIQCVHCFIHFNYFSNFSTTCWRRALILYLCICSCLQIAKTDNLVICADVICAARLVRSEDGILCTPVSIISLMLFSSPCNIINHPHGINYCPNLKIFCVMIVMVLCLVTGTGFVLLWGARMVEQLRGWRKIKSDSCVLSLSLSKLAKYLIAKMSVTI